MSDDQLSAGSESDLDDMTEAGSRLVQNILDNHLSTAQISPSGELFRFIARHDQSRRNAITGEQAAGLHRQPTSDRELVRAARVAMDHARETRRRLRNRVRAGEARDQPGTPAFPHLSTTSATSSPNPQLSGPSSSLSEIRRSRSHIIESGRSVGRLRNTANTRRASASPNMSNMTTSLADLDHAGQQLESESSHLRTLLDDPIAPMFAPRNFTSREHTDDTEASRPFKRRRLDRHHSTQHLKRFKYGYYGQVEPGRLNMEIDSCDGGIYPGEFGGSRFAAGNILLNDDSVYCTKGNRCNLVLRHQGGTPFCLQELIIKAPLRGYTAPVQEGMVFVSMTSDDLLTRTAQYQIQYSSSRPSCRSDDGPPVVTIRHNPDGSIEREETPLRVYTHSTSPNNIRSHRLAQLPSDFTHAPAQSFQVTTICSDDEDGEHIGIHRQRLFRSPIGARFGGGSDDEDNSDGDPPTQSAVPLPWHDPFPGASPSPPPAERSERRSTASQISVGLMDAIEAAQDASQEAVKAVGGGLMAPHARFFIEREKSKCTIRFDPPVSGRFILLKMWSPCHNPRGNIDIQSVVVKGFAGPRFFPAVQLK